MGTLKTKMAGWSKDTALVRVAAGALTVVLILLICLCISICMRSNIHKKYAKTMQQLEVHAYENMIQMTELFARIDDPNVDVKSKLLPHLYSRYQAVAAINAALGAADEDEALLSQEQLDAFEAAFELYSEAYRQGSATGLAKADMAACMEDVQKMVDLYNEPPEEEKNDVLVIDASSGKAVKK